LRQAKYNKQLKDWIASQSNNTCSMYKGMPEKNTVEKV